MISTPPLRNPIAQPASAHLPPAKRPERPDRPERPERTSVAAHPVASESRKPAGYGLPCAKCRTYYSADLTICPVCKTSERVSATPANARTTVSISQAATPDPVVLEQERDRFLKEFKAQMASVEIAPQSSPARCIREENHPIRSAAAPPVICHDCYEHLQERVDVLEAALHMDMKEAAQIVYQAVWANPSDPKKTYQNAAHALLSELRKRSGVTPTFTLLEPPMAD
jgi:hypothetical protein